MLQLATQMDQHTNARAMNQSQAAAPPTTPSEAAAGTGDVPAQPSGLPGVDDFFRVPQHCAARKCFRLQWESQINPRLRGGNTAFSFGTEMYVFDGFFLLCHGDPTSVPQFEYTRGNVECKVEFVPDELPPSLRPPVGDAKAIEAHFQALFLLQRYLFHQLLWIQPTHLFATPPGPNVCTDYHIIPRFIAVHGPRVVNKHDLNAPNRIGFARGELLPIERILSYLEETSKFTATALLSQFDHQNMIDCIVSVRLNGHPHAFRVDELVYRKPEQEPSEGTDPAATPRREVEFLKHAGGEAWHFDGAGTRKVIRRWEEVGPFLQLSPRVEQNEELLKAEECHLTGLRSDVFELGSAMPMILKFVRHCNLLTSFDESMGLRFKDKALLRQAFTHGSYVDVGVQSTNTVEATMSRVRLGYVFENTRSLKRGRDEGDNGKAQSDLQKLSDKHLSAQFKQQVYSKYLCPYERLEFLGDAVLSFLVASSSFLKMPQAQEGDLHQIRVDIVNNKMLGDIAKVAKFDTLFLSAFDLNTLAQEKKQKIIADCMEALLGALFQDQGIEACRTLLGKLIGMFDQETKDMLFLSNDEMVARIHEYVEVDDYALKQSKKYRETIALHRQFTRKTGVEIKRPHLWLQCMTHNSFKAPQIDEDEFICQDPSYERIEFLGDAVLQLLSSAFLVDVLPHHQECLLSNARSSLVKNKRLAIVARKLGYGDFIRVGNEVKKNNMLYTEDVLADVYEATLGAIFLENGGDLSKVRAVLEKTMFPLLEEAILRREWMNAKAVFGHHCAEWSRLCGRPIRCSFKKYPTPATASTNPNTMHSIGLMVNDNLVARASGRTISAAQEAACEEALRRYGVAWHEAPPPSSAA
ncbi:TPA: hypothetical protein N0F65_001895 [Lagenidium giganteum]|uniref:RNase III domain-containing protein n=1 Tax=Lagenidium giganteum TaxID=4803 RepID=A0AAV2Z266_9STRA|nr:TPA: hypothetical protein N0F65_001895 [Lagenidium giganteum]